MAATSQNETSSDTETAFERSLVETSESRVERERAPRAVGGASEDDHLSEARIPWAMVLLMSYASAATLALSWFLWTGRSSRPTESPAANVSQPEVESVPKIVASSSEEVLPPLPAENVASLGKATRIGSLEVTPLRIVSTRLDLVRSISPVKRRREQAASLVLRLRLKNISRQNAFAPLELRFLREQTSGLDRSAIATSAGQSINLFPLAVDSEWVIRGQEITVLKPGQSVVTLIASEPGVADRLTDEMIWRVRLRIGTYRTDVLGVRFKKKDIDK